MLSNGTKELKEKTKDKKSYYYPKCKQKQHISQYLKKFYERKTGKQKGKAK